MSAADEKRAAPAAKTEKQEALTITITITNLSAGTEAWIADFLSRQTELLEIPHKTANRMQIAADEIYSNIVRYSGADTAAVSCRKLDDAVVLVFEDNGIPYDPTKAVEPDTSLSAEERAIGGLGILMVRRLVKNMEYVRSGDKNVLTLTFSA